MSCMSWIHVDTNINFNILHLHSIISLINYFHFFTAASEGGANVFEVSYFKGNN
jgi:hypothetical protein